MSHRHLSFKEREVIQGLLNFKIKPNQIAKRIKRHLSTVYREIKRNSDRSYRSIKAHREAAQRRKVRKKKIEKLKLENFILGQLKNGASPEQIAGRIKLEKKKQKSKGTISTETIYQYIYNRENGYELTHFLRNGHKIRKNRKNKQNNRIIDAKNKKSIHERPKIIEKKEE